MSGTSWVEDLSLYNLFTDPQNFIFINHFEYIISSAIFLIHVWNVFLTLLCYQILGFPLFYINSAKLSTFGISKWWSFKLSGMGCIPWGMTRGNSRMNMIWRCFNLMATKLRKVAQKTIIGLWIMSGFLLPKDAICNIGEIALCLYWLRGIWIIKLLNKESDQRVPSS